MHHTYLGGGGVGGEGGGEGGGGAAGVFTWRLALGRPRPFELWARATTA